MFDSSQDLSMHLVYLQKLPVGGNKGLDEQETRGSIGSPYMDKGRPRAFSKKSLWKNLGNCLVWAETS
jgi:hypothetical protein